MSYRAQARFYFHRWKSLTDANDREVARGRGDILVGSSPEDTFVLGNNSGPRIMKALAF